MRSILVPAVPAVLVASMAAAFSLTATAKAPEPLETDPAVVGEKALVAMFRNGLAEPKWDAARGATREALAVAVGRQWVEGANPTALAFVDLLANERAYAKLVKSARKLSGKAVKTLTADAKLTQFDPVRNPAKEP